MSASSKFDLSSSSPDRPLYTSGQRVSYAAASLDRSGSFRENLESPMLPAVANMTRGTSTATQGDVMSFFQCLRFDPKAMVTDHKLKRLASVSLGIPLEDSPSVPTKGKPLSSPLPEEFRQLRASVRKGCSKARERIKIFNESLSVMNKWFPTIPSRKRSRSDALSGDRSNTIYANDRSISGTSMAKIGTQSHVSTNGFEVEQKSEERTKNSVPNKRTRSSMVDPRTDARANTPARPSATADRDREVLKIANSSAVQSGDRTLPIGVDGWEKSKMKKKRSGIKPDGAASSAATKPIDGSRDSKQGMPRLLTDARSRLSENHGFRPGVNGGVGKADGAPQQNGSGIRSSISRPEHDNSPLVHEKRDRPIEKERVNLKAMNKTSALEDFSSGSPTSSAKLNASARAPRSGSSVGPKLSPVVSRATAANDWEISQCTSKIPSTVGVNSRKRTPSMRSSSPPVAQWASQRPQKISRTARRTNFIPIVQSNDESSALDTTSVVIGNERCISGSSPQQVKLKNEHFTSAALSESDECGAVELKFKDKIKKSNDMDEKAGQHVQKMSNLMLPPRKNKVISGEDPEDGVQRQGRTGRGFTSTRSLMPLTVEKLGNVGTAKQLRSSRLGFDKTESKPGRPPTRKLSDRKAYTRQKHTTVSAVSDFLDDGHEELLASANAVINPAQALSSSFWKQMEPIFRLVSESDVTYLRQQVDFEQTVESPMPASSGMENVSLVANSFGFNEIGRGGIKTRSAGQGHLSCGTKTLEDVPLYQRLMSALIPEGDEEFCCSGDEDLTFDAYDSGFELETNLKSDSLHSQLSQISELPGLPAFNGYRINADRRSFNELEHIMPDDNSKSTPNTRIIPSYDNSQNGFLPDCTEVQYNNMSINERLLLEIHCIGIFPELAPDSAHIADEEISMEINKLNEMYHEQVSKRNSLTSRLLKSAAETRELQNTEFEHHALDKLIVMAYEKYMTCWGPNAHGMKSASGKMAKQAALAFVKRTVVRCKEFQDTGKSCFNEPLYRDIFLSGCSQLGDGQTGDSIDGEAGKHEVRPSASLGAQQSPSLNNHEIYFSDNPLPASEQNTGKVETWSNRVKKKELLLDDVGGGAIGMSSAVTSGIGSSFPSSTKGKRSERDREGKGGSREVISRSGTTKLGRPTSANVKGERKSKTKPKHKTTQSASVNSLLGKMSEKPKGTLPSTQKTSDTSSSGIGKDKSDYSLDELEDPIDLSGLQIPEMDDLGVPADLGGQGQDIGSWLNIDDDALQDHDFMGLEIPLDDISEINIIV
ncbi:hypothetical protein ACH5RR_006171 [Cinchona calisaya]|uniref:Uncharacterized protein n=1 Tax=Cinchona calisaya TaxID=153742 RepID=A0ABD3AN80_9GENT